jgi:hypothetical protein
MGRRRFLSLQLGVYLFVTHGGGGRKAFGVPQCGGRRKPGENPWRRKTRRPCSGIKSVAPGLVNFDQAHATKENHGQPSLAGAQDASWLASLAGGWIGGKGRPPTGANEEACH